MDFAPYQDTAPETIRALSPPPNRTLSPTRNATRSPPPIRAFPHPTGTPSLPAPSHFNDQPRPGNTGLGGGDMENGRLGVLFETSLPLRLDHEAMLAYLLLPPAGPFMLLVVEHKSDYIRFHAWQSSLLFTASFIIHLIFAWSTVLSWILFVGDLGLIGLLTFHAYRDADGLDRYEVPFFGGLASSFVDAE